MIQNTLRLNTPPLNKFINEVLPRHRDFFFKENKDANELDFLESLNEIYSIDLSDYIRFNGKDYFDDEVYKNRRIIEYLRQQIAEFENNRSVTNRRQAVKPDNNLQNVNLNKNVLTLDEAATFVGLSKSALYKLTSRGVIEFSKPNGKTIFIEKAYLEKWMMSGLRKNKEETEREAMSYCTLSKKKG